MKKITLSVIFQDHMMIQRERPVVITGTAMDMHVVHGCIYNSENVLSEGSTQVENYRFSLTLPPIPAGQNLSIALTADDDSAPTLLISDVSCGDIWMAMGQSNMQFALRYDADWQYTRLQKRDPSIHMFNVPQICFEGQKHPQPGSGYWFTEGTPAWASFSAPGYYFARYLRDDFLKDEKIPAGVIGCSWDGTPACAWMSEDDLMDEPLNVWNRDYERDISPFSMEMLRQKSLEAWEYENSYHHQMESMAVMYGLSEQEQRLWMINHENDPQLPMGPWNMYRPSGLYHTMLEKITPLSVRGILWYQGESDSDHPEIYDQMLERLIARFRILFRDPGLPFLMVQLAPFERWLDCSGKGYTVLRACQQQAADTIPDTWMASIMDLGSRYDIHPKFKKEVGRRLALLAEKHVYGRDDVLADAPAPVCCHEPEESGAPDHSDNPEKSFIRTDRTHAVLTFENAGTGLYADETPEKGFRIFQGNREIPLLEAEISGDQVTLTLDDSVADAPISVSYCEEDYCSSHIWNSSGLSVRPFHCTQQQASSFPGEDPI